MPDDRRRILDRHINERYLATQGDRWAHRNDAQFHAELSQVRNLITATEAAMKAEDIPEDVRDRVVFRLLYGEPPEVADWQTAAERAQAREQQIDIWGGRP